MFSGDSKALTSRGWVPVKDLIENAKLVADGIMALCCK